MRNKPTYAELVNRVRELEKNTFELQWIKEPLNRQHNEMLYIFNGIDQPVCVCDPETYELIFSISHWIHTFCDMYRWWTIEISLCKSSMGTVDGL